MSQPAEKRMGVSDARQNMTEVIAEVRLLGTHVVLTRREKPQAVLVPVEFYEQALRDRALVEFLEQRAEEPDADAKAHVHGKARTIREALYSATSDMKAALGIEDD
jgi:prevent-host-death family protein